MDQSADDSSFEISLLLRTLPVQNSNKKRVRALNRFRDYVAIPDNGVSTAASWRGRSFYDDDVLWLLTGHPPSGSSERGPSCGLVPACGEPSSSSSSSTAPRMSLASVSSKFGNDISMSSDQHRGTGGGLKRSAANAIRLLFYLVFEAKVDDGDEVSRRPV